MPIPWEKIPWDKLIAIAERLINNSAQAGATEGQIKQQIINPGPIQRIRMEREVRTELGYGPVKWRRERDEIMGQIYAELKTKEADDPEVQELYERGVSLNLEDDPDPPQG